VTRSEPDTIIRQVSPADLPRLTAVLGRALEADPIFQWLFGGSAVAHDIAVFAEAIYAQPAESGMVWQAGDGQALAVWVPPGAQVIVPASAPGGLGLGESQGVPNHDEVWTWLESFVPGDAWYLEVVGVDPDAQGTGLGGALVTHGLERAGAAGCGAFLETSVARNVPFYRRFGFEVVDEGDMPDGGPHVWFMRVDP
jgi:ribosomal protein S18 acetylase RimI-like enzyme